VPKATKNTRNTVSARVVPELSEDPWKAPEPPIGHRDRECRSSTKNLRHRSWCGKNKLFRNYNLGSKRSCASHRRPSRTRKVSESRETPFSIGL
jgi:hypothetical protein